MQAASYEIQIVPGTNLLHITLRGFFTSELFRHYLEDRSDAALRIRSARRTHVALINVSACEVQTGSVVDQFGDLLKSGGERGVIPLS